MSPPYELTPGARFTCQQCAGCCHKWLVYLTPEEYDRLANHDWAADSPRLAGVPLFVEQAPVARGAPPVVRLVVDDDGPGLSPLERDEAQAAHRGRRLDETKPGSGLGLSIVVELADLYGGALSLGTAPIGGLRAQLVLPAG